jgi:CheY-like chemotaxis protein
MVVDDEWLNRELMEGILQAYGFNVMLANNGSKALAMLQEALPDLVLADVRMPDMSGYDLCKSIKDGEATRDLKVVILTALEITDHERYEARQAGADAILHRMTTPDELVAELQALL